MFLRLTLTVSYTGQSTTMCIYLTSQHSPFRRYTQSQILVRKRFGHGHFIKDRVVLNAVKNVVVSAV